MIIINRMRQRVQTRAVGAVGMKRSTSIKNSAARQGLERRIEEQGP